MLTYIVRRLLQALLVVIVVSFAVFILIRLLPGDPIEMLLTQSTQEVITPEMIEAVRHDKGLDKPIPIQYINWFVEMIQGDFGNSLMRNFDIKDELGSRVTVTLLIGLSAFILGVVIGPILGLISAVRRGKFIDNLVTVVSNIGITAPTFWIGILLIFFFGVRLKWLPIYGYTLPWDDLWMCFKQSIMPIFVTALMPIAVTARQTRSSVLEVLNQDYVRTAWAKGLSEKKVVLRHVLKNSLMPVVTVQGTMLRLVVGGSVVVETLFVIPGMGKFLVDAMLSRDYPVVQAVTLIMTVIVVLSSLIVDLLYGWLDPRIQYE